MIKKIAQFIDSVSLLRAITFFLLVPVAIVAIKRFGINAPYLVLTLLLVNVLLCCTFLLAKAYIIVCRFTTLTPHVPLRHECSRVPLTATAVHEILRKSGYQFNRSCDYAECGLRSKATIAALLGMASLILLGSYDNLLQFNGVVLVGTGNPSLLYNPASYAKYYNGPFMRFADVNFKLKGVERIMPNGDYPYGAAKLRLTDRADRFLWEGTLAALGAPHNQNGFLFAVNSLEYNIGLVILVNGNHILYTDWLHLVPLTDPVPGFTHEGRLTRDKLNDTDGTAFYNEVTERLQLHIRYKNEQLDVELGEAPNHEKQVGRYKIVNQGTARQVQVRVSRVRHKEVMLGLIAATLLAGTSALFIRRRRLWIRQGEHSLEILTDSGRNSNDLRQIIDKLKVGYGEN